MSISPGLRAILDRRDADHVFAVRQIAPRKQLPPLFGVSLETRYPEHLFFPTLHVHGGHAPGAAGPGALAHAPPSQRGRRARTVRSTRPDRTRARARALAPACVVD
ncbi:hypothetical protein ACMHYB_00545 [Sorangium sp. So ce1128]